MSPLVQRAFDIGMVQVPEEIGPLAQWVEALHPRNVLEIGTFKGGTFYLWCRLSSGLRISIDLPGGAFGGDRVTDQERDEIIRRHGEPGVAILHGDSHSKSTHMLVAEILAGEKLGFLFIDGDHTYEGVRQDFLMYKDFVSPGGWIAFHDINDSEWHRQNNVGVAKLWGELKGKKLEFNSHQHWAGIGLIQGGEL